MMSLKIWILTLIYEIANSWKFIMFGLTLLLGYFLRKHFTTRLFSVKTFYCWAISYSMFFNHANVSAIRIVYGPILLVLI